MKASEFCDKVSVNKDDRFVIERIYRNEDINLDQWLKKIGNDFRSVNKNIDLKSSAPEVKIIKKDIKQQQNKK